MLGHFGLIPLIDHDSSEGEQGSVVIYNLPRYIILRFCPCHPAFLPPQPQSPVLEDAKFHLPTSGHFHCDRSQNQSLVRPGERPVDLRNIYFLMFH